jgi:hypothetical protein
MTRLVEAANRAVSTGTSVRPPWVMPFVGLVRNALFLFVVMVHAVRRMLPPY